MTVRFLSKNIASSLAGGLTILAVAGASSPCAAQPTPARPSSTAAQRGTAPTPATAPPVVAAPGVNLPTEYLIGADDVLSIIFWRDKELTADVAVRPDGKISLPLINDVHAAGL